MDDLKALLEKHVRQGLTPDKSNYARGRTRCWLEREMPLGPTQREKPGLKVPILWDKLSRIWGTYLPGRPETGLAICGAVGIHLHWDASYAQATTMSVNLGPALWFHDPNRNGATKGRTVQDDEWTRLDGGEGLVFNSKHPHAARPLDPARWVIILWQCK